MEISRERWATRPTGGKLENLSKWQAVAPELPTGHGVRKPAPLLTILRLTTLSPLSPVSVIWPPTKRTERRLPCCFLLTQGTASCNSSPSSVRPSGLTEPIKPFSFPFSSSVDSLQYSFGLLITARREADGSGFTDTITARSSSLHCLEACLHLSPNPFCHFWPSFHYFIFFHIKLNKPLVNLHISYRIQFFFCDSNECLIGKKKKKKIYQPVLEFYPPS